MERWSKFYGLPSKVLKCLILQSSTSPDLAFLEKTDYIFLFSYYLTWDSFHKNIHRFKEKLYKCLSNKICHFVTYVCFTVLALEIQQQQNIHTSVFHTHQSPNYHMKNNLAYPLNSINSLGHCNFSFYLPTADKDC